MNTTNYLSRKFSLDLPIWTILCPIIALVALMFIDSNHHIASVILGIALISAVLSAVHHTEVVAHKVGEPFGTIILALAITVIEVSLIISLMISETGEGPSVLARDTVFAAIMIILTGIIGVCIWTGSLRFKEQDFIKQGVSTALITLIAISILTLVLPNFTTSEIIGVYSESQLIFVAIISLILYGGFISVQTIRHRNFFLPQQSKDSTVSELHVAPPNTLTTISALGLMVISLIAVVLLSKKLSPAIEGMVFYLGAPKSLVGIIIATVILLPEGLAAYKAAKNNRVQTSLNLALGSALASIGLTIPAVAIVCYFTEMQVTLGIDNKSTLLLVLSLFTVYLSLSSGRTNIQQAIVLLTLFATYLFTTIVP